MDRVRRLRTYHPFNMTGGFSFVGTYTDRDIRAELGEDIFQLENNDWYITHEARLHVGHHLAVSLFLNDIDSVIAVLQKAREVALERAEEFYAKDAVLQLSTTTL